MNAKESKAEVQIAKRRAVERIKAMRAETKEDYRLMDDAARSVRSMAHAQHRDGIGHDPTHRHIFQTDLRHALRKFFERYPEASSWVGTREQVLMLVNRHDIPVRDQFEFLFEAALDGLLKRVMISSSRWEFLRIDAEAPELEAPKSLSIFDK